MLLCFPNVMHVYHTRRLFCFFFGFFRFVDLTTTILLTLIQMGVRYKWIVEYQVYRWYIGKKSSEKNPCKKSYDIFYYYFYILLFFISFYLFIFYSYDIFFAPRLPPFSPAIQVNISRESPKII